MRNILALALTLLAGSAFAQSAGPAPGTSQPGHWQAPFATVGPALSSCGSGATLDGNSTDSVGGFTPQQGTCVLTFAVPFQVAPFCVFMGQGQTSNAAVTAAGFTLGSTTAGLHSYYICIGR